MNSSIVLSLRGQPQIPYTTTHHQGVFAPKVVTPQREITYSTYHPTRDASEESREQLLKHNDSYIEDASESEPNGSVECAKYVLTVL